MAGNVNSLFNAGVWVYGSGSFAKEIILRLETLGVPILGVLNHIDIGGSVETSVGVFEIMDPADSKLSPESIVAVGVFNLHGDLHSIFTRIHLVSKEIRILTPVELFRLFIKFGNDLSHFWLTSDFGIFDRDINEINRFRDLLEDQDSKSLFDLVLRYRRFGQIADLPRPRELSSQYLADDLLTPPLGLRIIDLGACQGENLEHFIASGRKFLDGYLFEPDIQNVGVLKSKISELDLLVLKIIQKGAWSEAAVLKFDNTGNPSSSLNENGLLEIEVVALDQYLPDNFHPNFIKMDIEGSELNALKGMTNIIKRDRPHLAISVYHKPQDLWELGNYLNETYPGSYTYFLRTYGHQTFDTILYAIPHET